MRRKLFQRRWLFGIFTVGSILLTASEAYSQAAAAVPPTPRPTPTLPRRGLPPRPPISLNNNASLYTFPNPNFGLPSQHPFAFVAVAHEDCRLYHNGALLMPLHRLMAAECMPNNRPMAGGGVMPIAPINPIYPPYPPPYPYPPFPAVQGGRGGVNYNRYPVASPIPSLYASNTAPAPASPSALTTTSSSSPSTAATTKFYRGFGLSSESSFGGFATALSSEGKSSFGNGFDRTSKKEEEQK